MLLRKGSVLLILPALALIVCSLYNIHGYTLGSDMNIFILYINVCIAFMGFPAIIGILASAFSAEEADDKKDSR